MNNDTELDLVASYATGDEGAFTTLYRHYAPLLRTWALFWLDGFHRDAVDDIVQQVFIDFHENRCEPIYCVQGYLRNLLNHRLNNYKQACMRQKRNPNREIHGYEVSVDNNPATQVEQAETARLLRSLVSQLPERERHCIEQVYLAGRSCRDYASELNTHVNNVRRWTQEGLNRLREYRCQHTN